MSRPTGSAASAPPIRGIEWHPAVYTAALAMLFVQGRKTQFLHTHPTELYDIYCSEAYLKELDTDVG